MSFTASAERSAGTMMVRGLRALTCTAEDGELTRVVWTKHGTSRRSNSATIARTSSSVVGEKTSTSLTGIPPARQAWLCL